MGAVATTVTAVLVPAEAWGKPALGTRSGDQRGALPPGWPNFEVFKVANELVVPERNGIADWADFVRGLPVTECRFAIYHFDYGLDVRYLKSAFVFWRPGTAQNKYSYDSRRVRFHNQLASARKIDFTMTVEPPEWPLR